VEPVGPRPVEEVSVAVVERVRVGRSGAHLGVCHRGRHDGGEVVELGSGVEQPCSVAQELVAAPDEPHLPGPVQDCLRVAGLVGDGSCHPGAGSEQHG
jgi:hypothetical protein